MNNANIEKRQSQDTCSGARINVHYTYCYPTNNALLIYFRLSFDVEILLISTDCAYKSAASEQKYVRSVHIFQLSFHFAHYRWWLGIRTVHYILLSIRTALPHLFPVAQIWRKRGGEKKGCYLFSGVAAVTGNKRSGRKDKAKRGGWSEREEEGEKEPIKPGAKSPHVCWLIFCCLTNKDRLALKDTSIHSKKKPCPFSWSTN